MARPSVPPLRGRDALIPPAPAAPKPPPKRAQTMTYLPAEVVLQLEQARLELLGDGIKVNRSDLIEAAIELALDSARDEWLTRVRRGAG